MCYFSDNSVDIPYLVRKKAGCYYPLSLLEKLLAAKALMYGESEPSLDS